LADAHSTLSTNNIATVVTTAPSNGSVVANLYAEGSAAPTGSQSYTVDVTDNGAAIYSCSITAGNTSCTNTNSGVNVSSGHRIQVKITNVSSAPKAKFRMSYQYY